MRLRSLFCTRFFRLPKRLPWMSSPNDIIPLHLLLEVPAPLGNPDKKKIAVNTLETLYLRADSIVHDYVVSQITLWKLNKLPNHEFVVAHISYRGTIVGALRMERTVEPTDEASVNSSSVSVTSSSSPLRAYDPITVYASEDVSRATKESQLIAQQVFEGNVTIATVIAASAVLTQEYPLYKLRSKQCYWFAGLVFRLIAGDSFMPATRTSRMRAGEFASFLNIMQEPELTEQARAMRPIFEAKLRQIEDAVAQKLAKERAGAEMQTLLTEAQKQAQEAEKQAQEAERHAQEAEGHAQEAERHAQEAERQRAELAQAVTAAQEAYELEIRKLKEALTSLQAGTAPSTA